VIVEPTLPQTAGFHRATTLAERLASLRAARRRAPPPAADPVDKELARTELESWRAQAPFAEGDWFARRLALDGLSEDELRSLLGEPVEALAARSGGPPEWLARLLAAYERAPRSAVESLPLPAEMREARTVEFLDVIEPLIAEARTRLHAGVERLAAAPGARPFDSATIEELIFGDLPYRLHMLIQRALVLELNVARLQGAVRGDTPEARFADFLRRLREREAALAFLADYPVLARTVVRVLDRWVEAGLEFLERLVADWDELRRAFAGPQTSSSGPPDVLTRLDGGAGDPHKGGRAVMIAHFARGWRVVYKPRPMAIDVHFQELLAWLNRAGDHPPFRTLCVLDRGDWGWVEFVAPAPCTTREEVRRFHRRQGAQLALLHALEATDFHFENVIASGEHPVLVDLETLFHPRVDAPPPPQADMRLVSTATTRSVLRIGLLPQRTWSSEDYAGVDLSGMSSPEGQLTPDKVLQWEAVGTDEMHATRQRLAMEGARNRPRLGDAPVSILDDLPEVLGGFEQVYRLILAHREELLAPGGPVARFADDPVRCVLRATRHYGLLLMESWHPDFQRDGLELERFLDRLWVGVDEAEYLLPVIASERADLLAGDIPVFTARIDGRDLVDSRGVRIAGYWPASGLDNVRRRLGEMGAEDLRRQLWFVQASLATLTLNDDRLQWPSYRPVEATAPGDRDELRRALLAEASAIGDHLAELALRDGEDATWIGLAFSNRQWGLVPLMEDLYAGSAGVIHFLGWLGHVTGESRHTELARVALHTLRRRLADTGDVIRSIGAFSGLCGPLHVFGQLRALWHEPALGEDIDALLDLLPDRIAGDEALDVVGGSAGCLAVLLALDELEPDPRLLPLARACGERIVTSARPMPSGVGWFTQIDTDKPITGFSHGGSGLAWALLKLARATGDERYRATALEGLRYESSQFLPEEGNWLDTSSPIDAGQGPKAGDKALSLAWCYGAPGIGLSRLHALSQLGEAFVREEAEVAVRTTLRQGFGRNHCLCHGDMGNLDVLLQAAGILRNPALCHAVDELAASVLASMRRDGWICGVPLGVESPALMNGLAGIGYGLLRIAEPERVPSVLALAPPRL